MPLGCTGLLGTLALMCVWLVMTPLVVFFAPGSWFTGFVYGVGTVAAAFWLGMRSPAFAAYAKLRSPEERAFTSIVDLVVAKSPDPRSSKKVALLAISGALTLGFTVMTLLFLVFTVATAWKNDFGPNLTGASMGFGFWSALTLALAKITMKVRAA